MDMCAYVLRMCVCRYTNVRINLRISQKYIVQQIKHLLRNEYELRFGYISQNIKVFTYLSQHLYKQYEQLTIKVNSLTEGFSTFCNAQSLFNLNFFGRPLCLSEIKNNFFFTYIYKPLLFFVCGSPEIFHGPMGYTWNPFENFYVN